MRHIEFVRPWLVAAVALAFVSACSGGNETAELAFDPGAESDADGFRAPSAATIAQQATHAAHPIFADRADFDLANRGFIARDEDLHITTVEGDTVWRPRDYAFLDADSPASVHPSLWRQARLNNIHGLFEVVEGIYQVRGYDLSNMSIIDGPGGRILIDPLTSVETARAAMDLVNRELGERPIRAIILTHSHIDHFGGLEGVVDPADIESGEVALIAPAGFLHEAVSENVLAGVVMGRRASYMYGFDLPRSPRGHVGSGLGKHPAIGTHTIASPTHIIDETGQTLEFAGIQMEFQFAPHTEAPAELTIYFPDFNAWCGAEIVSRNMHNLYTLRGAQVRDALLWSEAIEDARRLYGQRTEIVFNSHHWPVWGQDEVEAYLAAHRDIYKYIHDQTLRLAAQGLGPDEIADVIALPAELENTFSIRGYYGTLRHNSRAVYQRYFGWYDGVPAHLNALPRTQAADRYVEAMGGVEAVLALAQAAFDEGDLRWSAELAQHAVFAAPGNGAAREALARSYEQLGYLSESAPWRNVYLTGAYELRHGIADRDVTSASDSILNSIPLDMFFTAMATRLDGPAAAGLDRRFVFDFTDTGEIFTIEISNGVMRHRAGTTDEPVDARVAVTRAFWLRLIQQEAGLFDMISSADFAIDGDRAALLGFFALLEQPEPGFEIVTP